MRDYAYFSQAGLRTRVLNRLRGLFRLPFLERALQRRVEGRPVDGFWSRLVPPEHIYPKGSWRTVERYGLKLRLDLSNANDHGAYFALEQRGDELLFGLVRQHHTVLDIGGNIGLYALRFAALASHGRVVTFEPDPDTFARLEEHIALNAPLRPTAVRVAIGAEESVHRLYRVVASNSGMNRIISQAPVDPRTPFREVRVVPLEKGLEGLGIERVDLIKIDVEGFEDAVLAGSETIVRRHRPVLFIEVYDENLRENGSSARALVDRVTGWGYTVREATERRPITADTDLTGCAMDIVCFPGQEP